VQATPQLLVSVVIETRSGLPGKLFNELNQFYNQLLTFIVVLLEEKIRT